MSHWQHKNTHNRHLLLLKIAGLCLFFHCLVLVWVFFVYDNGISTTTLSLKKHIDYTAPIMFMPIGTNISTSSVAQQKSTPIKTQAIIPEQKNTVLSTIKQEPAKPVKSDTQPQPKKEPSQEKKVTENITPAPAKIAQPKHEIPAIAHNTQISHDYKEVEMLRRNALLQQELVKQWQPPFGVPQDAACEVSFYVDRQGITKNVSFIKKSGIMMYDISARNAVLSMKMPQWTHGKTITINFTQ